MPENRKRLLSRKESADYLKERGFPVSPNTLQKYVTVGGGPLYQIFGNRALYTTDNLDSWAEQKLTPPRASSAA